MANMTTEPHTWTIVFASFWGFHLLFQFFRKASYAFPFAPPRNLGYKDKVDWNGRLVSTVHAVAMVVGTLLALDESRAYSDEDCLFGYGFYPATFASVFMGYLLYDSTYCWYYFKILKDWPSLVHHAIYLMVCGYVLHNMFFKFPFVWLMMGEISTPSVNLRWHLAALDKKSSRLYVWNGVLMAVLFFTFRVLGAGLGLVHLFSMRDLWMAPGVPVFLRVIVGLIVAGYALNTYWFTLVMKGVMKLQYSVLRSKKQ